MAILTINESVISNENRKAMSRIQWLRSVCEKENQYSMTALLIQYSMAIQCMLSITNMK